MKLNNKVMIIISLVIMGLAYFFIYKPYFTTEGKIWREIKEERALEQKVLYFACSLPKEHKYHKMLMKECNELELISEYEETYQDCTPDYMGSCN